MSTDDQSSAARKDKGVVVNAAGANVQVDGLSKTYGRFQALDGVGFSIRPGEILGLIGPNGAGKTTLFECVAGLEAGMLAISVSAMGAKAADYVHPGCFTFLTVLRLGPTSRCAGCWNTAWISLGAVRKSSTG